MTSLNPMLALSEGQMTEIQEAAEGLLEDTGLSVQHEGLLARAKARGARVDDAGGRVRFAPALLHELLSGVPRTYTISNVLGQTVEIGCRRPLRPQERTLAGPAVLAITNDPWIVDYETQRPRRPRLSDVLRHTIIAQRLDSVVCMSCMDYPVTDQADAASSWRALEVHLLNHAKHYAVLPSSMERFREWVKIRTILNRGESPAGSRLMTCAVPVLSPLTVSRMNAELLLETCAQNFAVMPTICPMAGTTAPYTLASTLLLAHCENLGMAALTQLVRPGNPFLYCHGPSVSDLRTARDLYYPIDKVLWKVAGVQLAKAYGMPCLAECGGAMTHRYDLQTGAEGMLFMLSAYASGCDLLTGLGSCCNAVGMSAEMMVIQEAWLDAAQFLARGINTEGKRLGIESIRTTGPGGNFLTDTLTLEFCRSSEFFQHALFDYTGTLGEGQSMLERAHQRVEELVSGYQSPVPDDIREGLARYFHDFYRT